MIKYGKIAAAVNESDVYLSDYEKLAAAIEEVTKDWNMQKWDKATDEGCILDTYDDEYDLIKAVFPDADKDKLHALSHVYDEAEKAFLNDNAVQMTILKCDGFCHMDL